MVSKTAIATKFLETAKRQPANREIFLNDGSLWVYRGIAPAGYWEHLGPPQETGFQGTGALHFELQNGLMVVGSPSFVLQLVLRAFYGLKSEDAGELVDMVYAMFKECGWRGPCETDNKAVPGSVTVLPERGEEIVHKLDDVRPVFSQLQDPEFNGWLSLESEPEPARGSCTDFVNVARALHIQISQEPQQ